MSPADSSSMRSDDPTPVEVEALRRVFGEHVGLEGGGALAIKMGIRLHEATPGRVIATMPVEGNTQPYGLLHGGASCVLAETVGSVAAALHAGPERIAVGIEINATHHRAATDGVITATADALHLGGTLASYEITIVDEENRRICTARLACLIRNNKPGT